MTQVPSSAVQYIRVPQCTYGSKIGFSKRPDLNPDLDPDPNALNIFHSSENITNFRFFCGRKLTEAEV